MSRGKRAEMPEIKLNIKKVIMVVIVILLIVACIVSVVNKDKILKLFENEDKESEEQLDSNEENTKTVEDVLAEFGGEVIEQPKSDTYFVSKEGKTYTVYADGEVVEEKVSFWSGQSSKPAIDEVGNINIYSAEELKWVADQVINGEANFSGVTITLRKSLDFGARIKDDGSWEGPIWTSVIGFLDELPNDDEEKDSDTEKTEENEETGVTEDVADANKENLKRFHGCFNGNGFSIRGICVDSDKNYQGLFGYSTGTVENVTLKNSYISGNMGTGGIVGLNGGIVRNCATQNTIVAGNDGKVGGIVGISMTGSTITQCHTENGQVKGKEYVAGIAGYVNNNTTITECSNFAKVLGEDYVGGIAGIAFFGTTIQVSDNEGKIQGNDYTGGIVGYSQAQIEKVYNTGAIAGGNFTAGLVGANFTMGDISKSYNTGDINGNNNVGGIVGTNNASTSNCYNTGNIKAQGYRAGGICGQNATESFIYNSYNIGKVEGNDSKGGVVGGEFGTSTKCYYLNTILENVETEQSKTEEDLKNNILEALGQEFVIDVNGINNGYPVLEWQI